MRKASGTVVAVVGEAAGAAVDRLGRAANVIAVRIDADRPRDERARAAWDAAASAHAPYVVHDADPLAEVADAWVRTYDGEAPRGELEVAVRDATQRWQGGSYELPDYYLVVDAGSLPDTRRHWYLGVLHAAAPARVVPVDDRPEALRNALASLATGRWWPDVDTLLNGIDRVVPDRVGLPAAPDEGRSY